MSGDATKKCSCSCFRGHVSRPKGFKKSKFVFNRRCTDPAALNRCAESVSHVRYNFIPSFPLPFTPSVLPLNLFFSSLSPFSLFCLQSRAILFLTLSLPFAFLSFSSLRWRVGMGICSWFCSDRRRYVVLVHNINPDRQTDRQPTETTAVKYRSVMGSLVGGSGTAYAAVASLLSS